MDKQAEVVNFIKHNSFGILFSQNEQELQATHLPFLIDDNKGDNGVLIGHMAKPNSHWKHFQDEEVLVVFPGPHAYISASWYNEPNTVTTWNYVAVHVYGTVKIIDEKERLVDTLKKTVEFYESSMPNPITIDFNHTTIEGLMNGLVGFEIIINKIEGKQKLSQNHSIARQEKVINALKANKQYNSVEIAKMMEQNLKRKE